MAKLNASIIAEPIEFIESNYIEEKQVESEPESKEVIESETINEEFLTDEIFEDVEDEDQQQSTAEPEVPKSEPDPIVENSEACQVAEPAKEVSESTETKIEQPVELPWDEELERRKDEAAFFERLKELNVNIENAKETLNEAKEGAKLAKDTLSVAVAQLQNFASKGVQYRKKPVPKPAVDPAKQASKSEPTNTNEPRPEQIPESEWRSWETATILEGIEGLGAKKRDALIEHFPTFGKLMDARTESTKEHVSFHSLLPKGIGESIGTELINRMDAKIVPGM
jgi:hypothetical protein